ncbi:hypothetical protein QR685DRAFT_443426, partial [Neurospora intermedia]
LLGHGVQDHGGKQDSGGQAVDTSEWCFRVSRRGAVAACGTWRFQPCPATGSFGNEPTARPKLPN